MNSCSNPWRIIIGRLQFSEIRFLFERVTAHVFFLTTRFESVDSAMEIESNNYEDDFSGEENIVIENDQQGMRKIAP